MFLLLQDRSMNQSIEATRAGDHASGPPLVHTRHRYRLVVIAFLLCVVGCVMLLMAVRRRKILSLRYKSSTIENSLRTLGHQEEAAQAD